MNESIDTPEHTTELINTEDLQTEGTEAVAFFDPVTDDHDRPNDEAAPTEDTVAAEETASPPPPRVFISHKQDAAAINDQIARRLERDLAPHCASVYLDLNMLPGDEYVRVIEEELSNCDFLIALISEGANRSAWVRTITPDSDAELLGLTCRHIGLPPLAIVEATTASSETSTFYELGGSVDDLFKPGDAYE